MAAFIVIVVVPSVMISAVAASLQQRRSRGQLPPRPGQDGPAPVQRPGQVGHDPAPPGARPDQNRADLRTDRSRPGQPHPSGLVARAPRGIRPVPGAV
jgi:hypothetical protein